MVLLAGSELQGLPTPKSGKVREVYDLGDQLLIVSTDRISAFDVIMANGIPDKGRVLNQMSLFWFEQLADVVPNHVLSGTNDDLKAAAPECWQQLSGRAMLARKASVIPIECVVRGYMSGSLLKEYRSLGGEVLGLRLPDGLVDGSQLTTPIFTPATKAEEGHDENISMKEAANLVGVELAGMLENVSLALYVRASEFARARGLILADTKFEFGLCEDGLLWIDEALTPDSSRYWDAALWKPGGPQPSFDKQFVRDYLESIAWDKTPPGPELPADVVSKTREKYLDAYRMITGRELLS